MFNKPVHVPFDFRCSSIIVKDLLIPATVRRGKLVTLYDYFGVGRTFPTVRFLIRSDFLSGWFNVVAAPIKLTDILVGLVPGVTGPSINNLIVNVSVNLSNRTDVVNTVSTRASKVKDNTEPAKLTVSDFSVNNLRMILRMLKVSVLS